MNKDIHNIANNYFTLLTEATKISDEQLDNFVENPIEAVKYAKDILKTEWDKAPEIPKDKAQKILDAIAESPEAASKYAIIVMKRRWPEAEPVILEEPDAAIDYAEELFPGWPELEKIALEDPVIAFNYAVQVVKDRWPKGESSIFIDPFLKKEYVDFLMDINYEDED